MDLNGVSSVKTFKLQEKWLRVVFYFTSFTCFTTIPATRSGGKVCFVTSKLRSLSVGITDFSAMSNKALIYLKRLVHLTVTTLLQSGLYLHILTLGGASELII